jgi:branched-chain amino acid transport system ATP-binding protein/branched-chain amino acid transport system permease protein
VSILPRSLLGQLPPVAILAAFALVPVWSTDDYVLGVWTFILLNIIVVLGLDLLLGYAGQLSLGHGVFVAIGAFTSALLTTRAGWSGWVAMPVGVAVASLIAAALAVPTLRLRGYYLAMATLGFPVFFDAVIRAGSSWSGGASGVTAIPRLAIGSTVLRDPAQYYWLVLAFAGLALILTWTIANSRLGLKLRAIHADETAAMSRGVPVVRLKVGLFVFSAGLAALSGSLYVHQVQFVAAGTFGLQYSLMLVVMLVAGGAGRVWGGVAGVVLLGWLPELLRSFASWQPVVFGALLAGLMLFSPHGIAGLLRRRPIFLPEEVSPRASKIDPRVSGAGLAEVLSVKGLLRRFGGVTAVSDLGFTIKSGEILSIIGPNGAGKSTALALISGALKSDAGSVTLLGKEYASEGADRRALAGLGRTFQRARLIPSLTVFENVVLGSTAGRKSRAESLSVARGVLDRLGLQSVAKRLPDEINHYERRLTEVGTALASNPTVLLLDEPAAGLSAEEIASLSGLLRELRQHGTAIVLVDHVMDFVVSLSDRILVLEQGLSIADGDPQSVMNNDRVRSAYLGVATAHA